MMNIEQHDVCDRGPSDQKFFVENLNLLIGGNRDQLPLTINLVKE